MEKETEEFKRLFFAFEMSAPWPEHLPKGRLLSEENRHLTVAFLGHTDYSRLQSLLSTVPLPSFKVGVTGKFDKIVFLPKAHPRVVAWHLALWDETASLGLYARSLIAWLQEHEFNPDDRQELLLHVTLARAPFDFASWREAFQELPFFIKGLHLYESTGQLQYRSLWSYPLHLPFEELDHTADIAFQIRGETVSHLFFNGLTALAFKYPPLIQYRREVQEIANIDEAVILLNEVVAHADAAIGCPFKAVSFHGMIKQEGDRTLSWEMIVDV